MKAYHTLVTGDSGGGKTTFMREAHATFDGLSIWINHNGTSNVAGKYVSGQQAMRTAETDRLNYRTTPDNQLAAIGEAREFAHDYQQTTGYPVQLIVDEAQNALPDGKVEPTNPLKRALHEDRDKALKVMLATQDPTDLDYTPLKQVQHFVWVGPWSMFHDGFIRYFSFPREKLPTQEYELVTFDKRMNELYRGQTRRRYA